MTYQTAPPSLLDKLTLFWQNHFVTTRETVDDYRFVDRYLCLLRANALGNLRQFVTAITKDPAMLRCLNGNENEALNPNENYGRELQELFCWAKCRRHSSRFRKICGCRVPKTGWWA